MKNINIFTDILFESFSVSALAQVEFTLGNSISVNLKTAAKV